MKIAHLPSCAADATPAWMLSKPAAREPALADLAPEGSADDWASSQAYRAVFEQAAIGIAEIGRDGRFMVVNAALCTMLGYQRDQMLTLTCPQITHSDDRAEDERLLSALWNRETPSCQVEKRFLRRDGTPIWVRVTSSLVAPAGRLRPLRTAIVEDITERRRLEEEFRQAHKMEAVGRLASGIAHDFNNLLTAILGYADLAARQLPPESSVQNEIGEIQKAADMAASLTGRLLAFSRKQILAPRRTDLNDIVRSVDALLRRVIGEDIFLTVRAASPLMRVNVDPGQMEQVLLNLAVNARDAMPEGGTLTIETANEIIDPEFGLAHRPVKSGAWVRLSVVDSGKGMTPEVMSRIFEPFFTTKGLGHGTGLGLSTVYGIVQQSSGHIQVSSQPGAGSRFDVYLPPAPLATEPEMPKAPQVRPGVGRETILVVEDDDAIRDVARRTLERRHYHVMTAANARDGLELSRLHAGPIHLLVADVVMPGGSGPTLARHLLAERPEIQVLYASGYADDALDNHGVGGEFALLPKPYTPKALVEKVREVLDTASR